MKNTTIHSPHLPGTAREISCGLLSRSSRTRGVFSAALLCSILGFAGGLQATTYHVETGGIDGSLRDGSTGQPWKTLAYAATRAVTVGDLIQVGAGTFAESTTALLSPGVSVNGAGETQTIITCVANPVDPVKSWLITMGGWNADTPVAGNQTISNLTLDGNAHSVHQGIGTGARSGLTFHDLTFQNFSTNGLQISGSYTPFLSVTWPGSPPPDTAYCTNIQIYDCSFYNGALAPTGVNWAYGDIGFTGVKDSVIRNCVFDETSYGGWGIKGSWFKHSNVNNCSLRVKSLVTTRDNFSIEIWYAYDSQLFDNWSTGAYSIGMNTNVRIHHNEIVCPPGENASYAVEFGGYSSMVDHNWFDSVNGVDVWGGPYSDCTIAHNVFRNGTSAVFTRSGDGALGAVSNLHVYNNTLDNCGTLYNGGPISVNAQGANLLSNTQIKNNIVVNTTVARAAVTLGGQNFGDTYASYVNGTVVTNNMFYNNASGNFSQTASVVGTVSSPNTVANPLFKGGALIAASPYYELQPGSPAIGTGVNVGLPFQGSASNMGAFVQPIGQRIEAELNYSVVADVGTNGAIGVGDLNLDSDKCLSLFDNGDTLRIHFKELTAGYYDLAVRVRSGSPGVPTGYFAGGYAFKVDGVPVTFTGDPASVSALDSGGGGVYWGTMRAQGVYLPAGLHHVEVMMTSNWGFVDYLEVTGSLSQATQQDIGTVGAAGSGTYDALANKFTVTGSGADIWNTTDAFHYVYQTITGDGEIIARVSSLTNTDPWTKAGVMIRNTLAANSTHAFMAITPSNGAAFQLRATAGGASTNANGLPGPAPYWVRLRRVGNSFTGYKSADGITWTQVGVPTTITMGSVVYVGLALTSHHDGLLATGVFDSVHVTD